ncbi:MAG: hypothetical protein K8R74_15490 [Bacteroidales bacterium]|nr:hypothetical protein [Bacteroidales bacterium]
MKVEAISLLITIIGLIAFLISLMIIILGKKVGERGKQQIKVSNYIEIGTNSVLMLVIITGTFALAPLALTYWKPDVTADEYTKIHVNGFVNDEDGVPADNAKIYFVRNYKESFDTISMTASSQGSFHMVIENAKPSEQYEIICSKSGYNIFRVSFGFHIISFPITLKRGIE